MIALHNRLSPSFLVEILKFEQIWLQTLASHYCVRKWTVVADVDELFHYYNCENVGLSELAGLMAKSKQKVVNSYLLDVYPDHNVKSSSAAEVSGDPSAHKYYDFEENLTSSSRLPPKFSLTDGFYDSHKSLLELVRKTMVRCRIGMADRNFVYAEKASFFKFSKNMTVYAGHHRISTKGRFMSYAADQDFALEGGGMDPFYYFYGNWVQGVVLHRCFVKIENRLRYLPESQYKDQVKSVLALGGSGQGGLNLYDPRVSREVCDDDDERVSGNRDGDGGGGGKSTRLPYLGGTERQKMIIMAELGSEKSRSRASKSNE